MTPFFRSLRWPVVLLAVALAFTPLPTPAATSVLEPVRQNFFAFYTGAGAVVTNARWQESLRALESDARSYSRAGYLNADGSWSDIRYDEIPGGSWSPWDHFRRLTVMAKAYRTPGQALYGSEQLRASIEAAIGYVPVFYAPGGETPGNWWFWHIGAPLDLGPTLVLMKGAVRNDVMTSATQALSSKIGPSPYFYPTANVLKGQNLVWSSFTHLCLALLTEDETMMRASRDAMASVARQVVNADGIQADYSFQQHGAQLYTGGYGGSFANDAGKFVLLTRGTTFALPDANLRVASDFVAEGIAWGLYHNYFDVSVVGREVSKPWTNGYNGLAALLQMSEVTGARQAEIRSATAAMLTTWNQTLPTELAALASRFGSATPSWPSGHRTFFESDYAAHRRPAFFASVKMISSRTWSGERTNGENMLGSRQSDGRFYLVQKGNEFFGQDVFPVLDWSRLSGTTVEQKPGAADATYGSGTRNFVGGATDGRNGIAAMDFVPVGGTLEAKKAWMFLDDSIVFLTSNVKLLTGNRAETIVHQWPLSRSDAPLSVDGTLAPSTAPWSATLQNVTWAAADDVGYYFPQRATINAKRELRSGSWSQLGSAAPDPNIHTKPVLTIWYDHGAYVSNGEAAYVIVPNASAAKMASWAAAQPVTILRNDGAVSAARDNRNGATGIVFWSAAAVEGISADRPSTLYLTRDGRRLRLHVSDPTHATSVVRLTIPGSYSLSWASPGVKVSLVGRSTSVEVPVNGGKTTTVWLSEKVRRRAVRR